MPDRLYMVVPDASAADCHQMARTAVSIARRLAPKLSGASSRRFEAVWGSGYFGIHWLDSYVWFQEQGIQPFTMKALAGKTIPMWINDPTGEERRKNPKAETRKTAAGVTQVLIFRKAAKLGQRKIVIGPRGTPRDVPASFPGAPGRIVIREARRPLTTAGRRPGAIARGNVGVRWRFPGLLARNFLQEGLRNAAVAHNHTPGQVYSSDRPWR
jgi:hypothetical protein